MAPRCLSGVWARAVLVLLLGGHASCSEPGGDAARGRAELQRVRSYAATSRYGDCWARALELLDTRCRDLTAEGQSRVALRLTHCHLLSSGRGFPECPEGSEVGRCTARMDVAAFNSYTEFFTHTHSICHFLQSEAWQSRAESTMHRLTESSAGVAEQLQSTRLMAEDLMEAQGAALRAQQEILSNGEELRATLRDSAQGLRAVFSELSVVSQQQQLALSELFSRVSFLQSFLMMEAHSLSSCLYNAAALGAAFLLTATSRTSKARLLLLLLVCLNFYLEKRIYEFVTTSDLPEHQHMEAVASYVGVLRRVVCSVSLLGLVFVMVRHRDPLQQSLMVLKQLQETQRGLQVALQRAESLGDNRRASATRHEELRASPLEQKLEEKERICASDEREEDEGPADPSLQFQLEWSVDSLLSSTSAEDHPLLSRSCLDLTLQSSTVQDLPARDHPARDHPAQRPSRSPTRRQRRSMSRRLDSGTPLVYSVLVEDQETRYRLRSRRSGTLPLN